MGTREDGIVGEVTTLVLDIWKRVPPNDPIPFDPYAFDKVRIYASLEDAQADQNHIFEITTITKESGGKYSYIVPAINTIGIYYDRAFIYLNNGDTEYWDSTDIINSFPIRILQYGATAPGEVETVNVYFNIIDCVRRKLTEENIKLTMNREWARYGKRLVWRQDIPSIELDEDGNASIDLIETTTMTTDTEADVYYIIKIGRFVRKFKVTKGIVGSHLLDLPTVQ